MRKQDYLLKLIQSLEPNEKRYFKLFSGIQPGEKRYLRLFDALENKEQYDAALLSSELNIPVKQLADDKHYLSQALIKSLRSYDEDASVLTSVYRDRDDAWALLTRRMFDYALEVADKALAKAHELELYEVILETLLIKHSTLLALQRFKELKVVTEQYRKTAVMATELFELYEIRGYAMSYENMPDKEKNFKKLLQHPLLKKKVTELKSVRAKITWFAIMRYYYSSGESRKQKFIELSRAEVAFYKKTPAIHQINPVAYAVSFASLADAEGRMKNYESGIKIFNQLKQWLAKSPDGLSAARNASIGFYADMKIAYHLFSLQQFKTAAEKYEAIFDKLPSRPLGEQYDLLFYNTVTQIQIGNTRAAADILNELMNIKEEVRTDMIPYTRILSIMIQIDMGNYELVPSLVQANRVWLNRKKISDKEINLLNSAFLAIATSPIGERKNQWRKLYNDIAGRFKQTEEYLHIKHWIGNKI